MSGKFIVSLDFELFWGMLDVCKLEDYQENVLGGKRAIPQLLELFRKYDIHATWATVGFLFAQNKVELKNYFPSWERRPSYTNPELDPYVYLEKIGNNEAEAPCFFAPDLLGLIAETPGQEIGSHTFCHYYCWEEGQTIEQFAADMKAAKAIAAEKGYDVTSVVLPRNQCKSEYTQVLRELGYTGFRDLENDWIHRKVPVRIVKRACTLLDAYLPLTAGGVKPQWENGIWNLTGSKMYRPIMPKLQALEGLKIRRIKMQMRHAAKHGLTYHLWWHPHNLGAMTQQHLQQLEEIFRCYRELNEKYGMQSLNMRETVELLKERPEEGIS